MFQELQQQLLQKMFQSQAGQDQFVLNVLRHKRDGWFLEIGSRDPIDINNTFVMEKRYGWRGFLVEWDESYGAAYVQHRPKSIPVLRDATLVDFKLLMADATAPLYMDYLQIDLEVTNRSTLTVLENLDAQIFDDFKFATVTFEHDAYRGDHHCTRQKSREIFAKRGYCLLFGDVTNEGCAFEDWYVHPDLVDDCILELKSDDSLDWRDILKRIQIISKTGPV